MSSRNELTWQTEICKAFRDGGAFARKMGSEFQNGFPDLLIIERGRIVFLEVKLVRFAQPGRIVMPTMSRQIDMTTRQRIVIGEIRQARGEAYVLAILQDPVTPPATTRMGLVHVKAPTKRGKLTITRQTTALFTTWGALKARPDKLDRLLLSLAD